MDKTRYAKVDWYDLHEIMGYAKYGYNHLKDERRNSELTQIMEEIDKVALESDAYTITIIG